MDMWERGVCTGQAHSSGIAKGPGWGGVWGAFQRTSQTQGSCVWSSQVSEGLKRSAGGIRRALMILTKTGIAFQRLLTGLLKSSEAHGAVATGPLRCTASPGLTSFAKHIGKALPVLPKNFSVQS